jgi:pilus assembly protein CpaB
LNSRIRIGVLIALLGVVLVVAGFVVLSNFIQQSLAPLPPPTPVPQITQDVVVAARDVSLGTLLQQDDVKIAAVPVELVPRDRLTAVEQAVGRIVKADLVQGEMVLDHKLANPTNISRDLAFIIGDNKVLLAFPVTDLMTSLGILQRGDIVDILVTLSQEVKVSDEQRGQTFAVSGTADEEFITTLISYNAFQRTEITAVIADIRYEEQQAAPVILNPQGTPQPTPQPQPSQITVRALLLALDPQDALVLKHLKDLGATFDFVLRSPTSTEFFELTPVTSDYLLDKYELEILR